LAKHVFTNQYKKRPKSSLRTSMAAFKLPSAIALVHLSAYEKCPDTAKTSPTVFKVTTNIKSFLTVKTGNRIRNVASRHDRYRPICVEPQRPEDPSGNLLLRRWLGCFSRRFGLLVNNPRRDDGNGSGVKFEGTLLRLIIGGSGTFGERY
jgi:hypothetical protein